MQSLKLKRLQNPHPKPSSHPSEHDITSSFPFDGGLVMFRLF
jgi:hypothetical protein